MKTASLAFFVLLISLSAWADGLPVITIQPQNLTVTLSSNATLTVASANAAGYQWRFNGTDILGATNSTLQITNAQATNTGYYVAIVKNGIGWVPSQMAYVSVTLYPTIITGQVPLSDFGNTSSQAYDPFFYGTPIASGTAHLALGRELDELKISSLPIPVTNGYFRINGTFHAPDVPLGGNVYYAIYLTFTNASYGPYTLQSTVLSLPTGATVPSIANLKFPGWPEWPEPQFLPEFDSNDQPIYPPTNRVQVPGENLTFSSAFFAYYDFGKPTVQWRKDGMPIPGATNEVLNSSPEGGGCLATFAITNLQASDAGVYDLEVFGNNWVVSPRITVSVQLTNGPGMFQSPRFNGSQFVSDLAGAPSRNYTIQWSSNLSTWNDLMTVSNSTGLVTFTNATSSSAVQFYRTKLLP